MDYPKIEKKIKISRISQRDKGKGRGKKEFQEAGNIFIFFTQKKSSFTINLG